MGGGGNDSPINCAPVNVTAGPSPLQCERISEASHTSAVGRVCDPVSTWNSGEDGGGLLGAHVHAGGEGLLRWPSRKKKKKKKKKKKAALGTGKWNAVGGGCFVTYLQAAKGKGYGRPTSASLFFFFLFFFADLSNVSFFNLFIGNCVSILHSSWSAVRGPRGGRGRHPRHFQRAFQ